MYSRMYGTPDPSNPYNQGFPPGVQQFHQPPHYPSPSHHYPGGMPGVDNTGGSYHESFTAPSTPQQNDQWSRQQSQPQQQPSVVINDGGAVSDGGSPAPRSSIGWGPSGVRERGRGEDDYLCVYMYTINVLMAVTTCIDI